MPSFFANELAEWSAGVWAPAGGTSVSGVSNDTRTIRKGDLYFALRGPTFDGHAFVDDAFSKGAAAAVVSREWMSRRTGRDSGPGPVLAVEDTARALRDIAGAYGRRVGADMVGVTGSAGKSSVKDMIAGILGTGLRTARTRGNWNNDVGLPLSLLSMERTTQIGVFELGVNHPGEMSVLCRMIDPTCGVITNIGRVHMEFFGDLTAIAREKGVLLQRLPAEGKAVLNRDSECFEILRSMASCTTVTISGITDADYRCIARDAARNEATVLETGSGERCTFRLRVPGEHYVMNAVAAIAVGREYGIGWDRAVEALEAFYPLPMRWEVTTVGGVRVVNDAYNANPMSMRVALKTFAETGIEARKWLILGGMLELGTSEKEEHQNVGRDLGRTDWAGLIAVGRLGQWIADGAMEAGMAADRIFRRDSAADAVDVVRGNIRCGDAVLLKASRGIHLEEILRAWQAGTDRPDCDHSRKPCNGM